MLLKMSCCSLFLKKKQAFKKKIKNGFKLSKMKYGKKKIVSTVLGNN